MCVVYFGVRGRERERENREWAANKIVRYIGHHRSFIHSLCCVVCVFIITAIEKKKFWLHPIWRCHNIHVRVCVCVVYVNHAIYRQTWAMSSGFLFHTQNTCLLACFAPQTYTLLSHIRIENHHHHCCWFENKIFSKFLRIHSKNFFAPVALKRFVSNFNSDLKIFQKCVTLLLIYWPF